MSLYRLFQGVIGRLKRRRWGVRIEQEGKPPLDSGVEEFSQELYQALSSDAPIELSGPLRFTRRFSGPAFEVSGSANAIGYVAEDGATTGANVASIRVRVVSTLDDTLLVQDATGTQFLITKPFELRRSSTDAKTIDSITYSFTDGQTRSASGTVERVTPAYSFGDELIAVLVEDGFAIVGPDGEPLIYADSNVGGKTWQTVDTPANPADDTRWRIVPTSEYTSAIPRFNVSGVAFTKAISATTDPVAPNPVVVTTAAHGFITGQRILISGCDVAALNTSWVITRVSDTTFSLQDSTPPGSVGTTGTVTHDLVVTVDVSGLVRPQHRLKSLTHVTIENVLGATQANGTWTIDSGYMDIDDKTESGGGEIVIETLFQHGFSTGERIRVESLEKGIHDESEGTWTITELSTKTFSLDDSVFVTEYESRGGLCARATTFRIIETAWSNRTAYVAGGTVLRNVVRYVCILAHVNKAPPNATYWSVSAWSAYTSGGKVLIPGQITINSASTPPLTPTSGSPEVHVARAAAAAAGWVLGAPLRLRTASQTVYGVIVSVPGTEGFPYTDPAPLPTTLDNTLLYVGPPLLEDLTEIAIGLKEMVVQKQMICNRLPFFGAISGLPITPTGAVNTFRSNGGDSILGRLGKTFARWDSPNARCVAFAVQQDFAAESAGIGTFSGGTVEVLPDARRPGFFAKGIPLESTAWSNTKQYVAGEIAKDGNLYLCVAGHNVTGASNSRQPTVGTNTPDYWRNLNSTTLEWSNGATYVRDDVVVDNDALYICTVGHAPSQQPSVGTNVPDFWRSHATTIMPTNWSAATTYRVGNVVAQGGVLYRSILAHDNTPDIGAEPGVGASTATYWVLATRDRYSDGSVTSGSKITRTGNLSFSAGHPDSATIGWEFNNAGVKTYVCDSIVLDRRAVTGITDATPQVVTTAIDHELRNGQVVTISGSTVADGRWFITRLTDTTFRLNGSTLNGVGTAGRVGGVSFRQFIVEHHDLPEASAASYSHNDFELQPKINLSIGGQQVGTNDEHSGFRTRRVDNAAEWNPANEINVQTYDVVYNSRMEISGNGVGNQPGLSEADTHELTTFSEGTIQIDHGVAILSGALWPPWALFGEITIDGDTVRLEVDDPDDWEATTSYAVGNLVLHNSDVFRCILAHDNTPDIGAEPGVGVDTALYWTELGPTFHDGISSGYDTYLQLQNRAYTAVAGTPYVLRPVGHPAQFVSMFLTFVIV